MTAWWCDQPADGTHHTVSDRSDLLPCIKHRKANHQDPAQRKSLNKKFTEYRKRFFGKPQASARYWREKMALAACNMDEHSGIFTELCAEHDSGDKYH
eukprot:SAG31_NODE_19209_length_609_cov_0.976471_1_plen_97_part_10